MILFGPIGPEVLIIFVLIVILFGASRIPKLARSAGESITEFEKGRKESKIDEEDK